MPDKLLSEHFTDAELDVADAEERIVRNATWFCEQILEPLRAEVGPVAVHCGYRTPEHNREVGGADDSYHLYAGDHCAADIVPTSGNMQEAFDWLRLRSNLPFHKVILEHDKMNNPQCVHIQAHADRKNRTESRQAFTGLVAGQSKHYPEVPCISCKLDGLERGTF